MHVQRVNVLNENEIVDFVESTVDVFRRVDYAANCAGALAGLSIPSYLLLVVAEMETSEQVSWAPAGRPIPRAWKTSIARRMSIIAAAGSVRARRSG